MKSDVAPMAPFDTSSARLDAASARWASYRATYASEEEALFVATALASVNLACDALDAARADNSRLRTELAKAIATHDSHCGMAACDVDVVAMCGDPLASARGALQVA